MSDFPVSSTDRIPGYDGIPEEMGFIMASAYSTKNTIEDYPVESAANEAMKNLVRKAKDLDANGIVRVACQVMSYPGGATAAFVTGTAVKKPPLL